MGKIKINLDMLEEVRKQNEIAMNATEQVINNGREDLASMTEEVWEGEDGDMARELLDDLLNNKMAQTWRELDTIHESIKKAQKSAYEAKNFCNNFPLIFNSGTMPSDKDSSPCSGDLMCDKESCEQLKSSMEKAAQYASRVKSKTETLESILAELETPEAKFDYSSYTEPIKTQTQNVIDRVAIFNNAVTKYEQKVEELDQTLASELLAATPDTVLTPFDPSILFGGESVHMKDGDIVNFLEKYNIAELVEKLTDTQISNILAILFDKKDVNTAELSERDYEVAFLKLPEDKKIAILLEMGFTRDQIGSILASKENNGIILKQLFGSKFMNRIKDYQNIVARKKVKIKDYPSPFNIPSEEEMYDELQKEYGFSDEDMEYLKENYPLLLKRLYIVKSHNESLALETYDKLEEVLFIRDYRSMLISAGWSESVLTDEMLSDLRRTMIKYGIDSKEEICAFLSQCAYECSKGSQLVENGTEEYCKANGYERKFRGCGYIHLTHDYGYKAYSTYKILENYPQIQEEHPEITFLNPAGNDKALLRARYSEVVEIAKDMGLDISYYTDIVDKGAEYVAEHFAWDTAGYFWDTKGCDDIMDTSKSIDEVSKAVNGDKCTTLDKRREEYDLMISAYEDVMGE